MTHLYDRPANSQTCPSCNGTGLEDGRTLISAARNTRKCARCCGLGWINPDPDLVPGSAPSDEQTPLQRMAAGFQDRRDVVEARLLSGWDPDSAASSAPNATASTASVASSNRSW